VGLNAGPSGRRAQEGPRPSPTGARGARRRGSRRAPSGWRLTCPATPRSR
jgi:hypothetical protein